MKFKICAILMALGFSICGSNAIYANNESDISVILDGQELQFDQNPIIENGYTLVPMRAIFEKLGATVQWDASTKTIYAKKIDREIILQANNQFATVNNLSKRLDVPAMILSGRTLVPLRFVGEQLGVNVEWEDSTRTVTLSSYNDYDDYRDFKGVPDFGVMFELKLPRKEITSDGATMFLYDINSMNLNGLNNMASYIEHIKSLGFQYDGYYEDDTMNGKVYKYVNDEYTVSVGTKGEGVAIIVKQN